MDTLTPADGSVRFWVLSDDPRFQYGKGLAEIERMNQRGRRQRQRGPARPGGCRCAPCRATSPPFDDRPAVRLIVGVDSAPFAHTLRAFLSALALLTLAAVLLVMAARLLDRARRPAAAAAAVARGARAAAEDAVAAAAAARACRSSWRTWRVAFNGALDRLEAAYQQLEAFNADVAHELRTPLANLIGGTQVALSRQRSAAEFEETLQSNLEELERLRSIINDMLFLARADQGEAATGLVAGVGRATR